MTPEQRSLILADVEQTIAALRSELRELRRVQAYLSRQIAPGPSHATLPATPTGTRAALPRTLPTKSDAAEAILRKAGRGNAMRAPEIARKMVEEYGFPARYLDNRTLERRVYTVMSRGERFANIGDGKWTLREFLQSPSATNGENTTPEEKRDPAQRL